MADRYVYEIRNRQTGQETDEFMLNNMRYDLQSIRNELTETQRVLKQLISEAELRAIRRYLDLSEKGPNNHLLAEKDDPELSLARSILNQAPSIVDFREQFSTLLREHKHAQNDKLISIHMPKDGLKIIIHPDNLREILSNLLNNALKYTRRYGTMHAKIIDKNLCVHFCLVYEGPHLEPGEGSRIFQEGFRGSNAPGVSEQGHGRGLFIAREICNLYGIELLYRCREKRGETANVLHEFTLSFPKTMVKE